MRTLIKTAFDRSRTALLALLLIVIAGVVTYRTIPKEADPDVQLTSVYISAHQDGISPEDSDRLLVRPIDTQLQGLEGVKEIRSWARQDGASILIEFQAGTNIDQALLDVREKVDRAKPDLPRDADEPTVSEVNLALFPVIVVTLSGELPERALLRIARDLRDRIEALPQVLEVDIAGEREEVVEVIIDPFKVDTYGLELESLARIVDRNNQLVAAGELDNGSGRFAIKAPGVFENYAELMALPVKADGSRIVRLGDIASVHRTFKDADGFARVDSKPTLALEVKKRIGENIIETSLAVRAVVDAVRPNWPAGVEVGFSQDKSDNIEGMLKDLQNNVLSAVLLVMIVVVAFMGVRSAVLVGFAVPGAFLMGILVLGTTGLTVNIVVLFGLILAVGMLVDGAIVVTEYADRRISEGLPRRDAYRDAALRMAWPITASTLTTLAAFMPLLFWPGIVGEFMSYLPITLVATLSASLAMALIFVPVIATHLTKLLKILAYPLFFMTSVAAVVTLGGLALSAIVDPPRHAAWRQALSGETGIELALLWLLAAMLFVLARRASDETGPLVSDPRPGQHSLGVRAYLRMLRSAVRYPATVAVSALLIAVCAILAYAGFGRGVEFFPEVEPEQTQLHVHARGDLSVTEIDALVRMVEERVVPLDGIERVYARSGAQLEGQDVDDDTVGILLIEFDDWQVRRPAAEIMAQARALFDGIPGIHVEERKDNAGPPVGKPVTVEIRSTYPDRLMPVVEAVRNQFDSIDGLVEIADSRPKPGIEWRLDIDREQASRFGTDLATAGATIQLVTNGLLLGTTRPDDAEDELDIRARFPADQRHLGQLERLIINTPMGTVPLSNFIDQRPAPKSNELERIDGKRVFTVSADVEDGVLVDDKVTELRRWLETQSFDPSVEIVFRGEDEEQKEAQDFLIKAFGVALFLIAIILVTQFNSFYQALLILTAILFSTVGVMLGLLITNQPFGIIMSGVGVIALAGIVVNNNIVLIDTYNDLMRQGLEPVEAILETGAQRLRPVLLTTVTTILGLMPMVLKLNIDLFAPTITQGGPSTDWWAQLASAVAGGLFFATLITLVLTPSLLMLGERLKRRSPATTGDDVQAAAPLAAE